MRTVEMRFAFFHCLDYSLPGTFASITRHDRKAVLQMVGGGPGPMGSAGFPAKRQAEIDPGNAPVMLGKSSALVGGGRKLRHRKPNPGAAREGPDDGKRKRGRTCEEARLR